MAARAKLPLLGRAWRRNHQFKLVPSKKQTPANASGRRRALMAVRVRSKKWPSESLYNSGCCLSRSAKSTPGGSGGEAIIMPVVTTKMIMPSDSKTMEPRRPNRRNLLSAGEEASLKSQIPHRIASVGKEGRT